MKSDFFTFGGGHAWEDVFLPEMENPKKLYF